MNYEALDAFGINVSAASLENSEYVKSLGKTWNQLTDNEKMQAVYNEVTRQGASANGLAKQEADGFAMKMKLLKQQLKETVGTIGEKLLPVLQPLVDKFVECAKAVADWANKHPQLTQTILMVVGGLGLFLVTVGPLIMVIGTLIIAVGTFNVAMLPVIGTVAAVIAIIALLVAGCVALWQSWDTITTKASECWNSVVTAVSDAYNGFITWLNNMISGATTWANDMWTQAKDAGSKFSSGVITYITQLPNRVMALFNIAVARATAFAKQFAEKGKQSASDFKDKLVSGLQKIPSQVMTCGKDIVEGIWNGISGAGGWLMGKVSGFCNDIVGKVKGAFKIKSPSRVMRDEVGVYLSQGIAEGIEKDSNKIDDKFSNVKKSLTGSLNTDFNMGISSKVSTTINDNLKYNSASSKLDVIDYNKLALTLVNAMKELNFNIDGREVMRAVAPYKGELDKYDSRNPRFSY